MIRHKHKGFSLIELLIAMIAGAILLLSVGILSGRSLQVQKKTQQRAEIFNDVAISFRMMEKYIREAYSVNFGSAPGWIGDWIVIKPDRLSSVESAFGVRQTGNIFDFVYVPDISNVGDQDVLFSVASPGTVSLSIAVDENDDRNYLMTIQGIKNNIPFSLSTQAKIRRESW